MLPTFIASSIGGPEENSTHFTAMPWDANFPDRRLRARLPRQRSNRRGSYGQLQKFPTLHGDLLTTMPQLRAITRFQDDGIA
jgi:hypothetical protein